MVGQIATRGILAPIQVGRRWVIERTHAWGNQYGRLRWCTERRRLVVEFWLARATLAVAHFKDAPTSSASISVELTVDAGDDMVRIEVRDDDASLPGSGRVVSLELREASTAV